MASGSTLEVEYVNREELQQRLVVTKIYFSSSSSGFHLPLDALRDEGTIDTFVELPRERLRQLPAQEFRHAVFSVFVNTNIYLSAYTHFRCRSRPHEMARWGSYEALLNIAYHTTELSRTRAKGMSGDF